MVALLSRRSIVSEPHPAVFVGEIFRTCEFIPFRRLHIVAHSHIYYSRFNASAYRLLAIHGVVGGIHGIAGDEKVRTGLVLHGMVELHGDVSAERTEVYEIAFLCQLFLASLQYLFAGHPLFHFGQYVDKLSRCRTVFQYADFLSLCTGNCRHSA